jgi:hypothetical protein
MYYRRCACSCNAEGEECHETVIEPGERFCLAHRDPVLRRMFRASEKLFRAARRQPRAPIRRHAGPRRCGCTCTQNGGHCRALAEPGERFCLLHRDKYERARLRRALKDRQLDGLEHLYGWAKPRRLRWREWRSLTEADAWMCTTAISRGTSARHDNVRAIVQLPSRVVAPDRWYEETTALVRVPAASNWPYGRIRPHVRRWLETAPGRNGKIYPRPPECHA